MISESLMKIGHKGNFLYKLIFMKGKLHPLVAKSFNRPQFSNNFMKISFQQGGGNFYPWDMILTNLKENQLKILHAKYTLGISISGFIFQDFTMYI